MSWDDNDASRQDEYEEWRDKVRATASRMLRRYSTAAIAADMANEHAHDYHHRSDEYVYWTAVRDTIMRRGPGRSGGVRAPRLSGLASWLR